MITENQFRKSASLLGVEVAAIKAVAEVEGNGRSFLLTGEPIILFEPHVFWKELKKRGVDPNKHATKMITVLLNGKKHTMPCDDPKAPILYPTWVQGLYGPSSTQHSRLQRASKINREAALSSCSWGQFQIMGFNYKLAGFKTLQEFINAMYKDEDSHLQAFVSYIKNTYLDDELRNHDWKGFARGYNGPLYHKNRYDIKLEAAYIKHKKASALK